ncbi:lipoprotein HlpB [Haemophilus parahaemolyticus]|uniref:lipoprotein HlpB n=1 Tax=Haemophilus parahaemolyticus TaxID=735 RepID=UPI000DAD7CFB|nr:lipoprotein HlpB [Haemophilus parahaemolyticus]MDU4464216.1 lipoprotein HlpB [Haemophilus parahaemolyticus]RDE83228.1 lipoprotein HlpB [Haemophilus parahaemolyticus]
MTKLTKISATALFALFLTACDKPADKAAEVPKAEATPAAQTQAPVAQQEAAPAETAKPAVQLSAEELAQGKTDLQKILDWNKAQEQAANAAQQKLQTELATNDPKKVEAALVEFTKTVDETVKTLDAVEVKSPLVVAFKAKTKEVLTLSSSIVADSVKVMSQPTPESQNALAEKTQQLIQEGNVLQQLQAELQQTFGE